MTRLQMARIISASNRIKCGSENARTPSTMPLSMTMTGIPPQRSRLLSEGDTIATHLDGTENATVLTVERIERKDGYVTINGGMEEGGIDLCKEDDHYRTLTWDDYPAYYEVGVVKQLVMADDIELSDGAADFEADPVIVKGDRAVCDAMSDEEDIYGWNAGNTTVTIQDGEIAHIDRIWVP